MQAIKALTSGHVPCNEVICGGYLNAYIYIYEVSYVIYVCGHEWLVLTPLAPSKMHGHEKKVKVKRLKTKAMLVFLPQ